MRGSVHLAKSQPNLQSIHPDSVFVHACVCVRACMHQCMRMRCVRARACARACVRADVRECEVHVPCVSATACVLPLSWPGWLFMSLFLFIEMLLCSA